MPQKKVYRKKKRAQRRKKRSSGAPVVINRGISPLAQSFWTKLKYVQRQAFTVPVSGTWDYLWRLNSIFDPDRTGTGHQPYGHDTLNTMYNRYRVWKVDYVITYPPNISGALQTAYVNCENGETSYTSVDQNLILEYPRTFRRPCNLDSPTIIKGSINLAKLTGASKQEYIIDDRYQSQYGNNPTELLTLHTGIIGGTNATGIVDVMLIYHVESFDPVLLPQS